VRVCGFAKKIVLHSVQSTSNAVVVEYYYYFVLERGGYFLAIEEQNLIFYLVWLERVLNIVVLDGRGENCRVECVCRRVFYCVIIKIFIYCVVFF